eukprot:764127-Hanusia_phi.AAC.3
MLNEIVDADSQRVAAFCASMDCTQIEIAKGYGKNEWREDLKKILLRAGKEGKPTVFLFTDTQIVMESFLEVTSPLLVLQPPAYRVLLSSSSPLPLFLLPLLAFTSTSPPDLSLCHSSPLLPLSSPPLSLPRLILS